MTTAFCYSCYSWRVFQHNRFVGYVVAASMTDAIRQANAKYGCYVWVERITV